MKFLKALIILVIVVAVLVGFFFWTIKRMIPPSAGRQAPPPTVQVATPDIQDVVNYNEFTGNLESIESVQIRARVQGYLEQIAFKDGGFVDKGDLLFVIEPQLYKAQRDRAQAQLESAQADLERARQDYDRAAEAVKSHAVSQQQVSTYKAQRDMAEASVLGAKAALAEAELNLSYTRIESPIAGKISRNYVDVGNLVGSGQNTLLADVVTLDPIYVYFNASESEYLDYTRNVREELADEPNQLPVHISLANDEQYPQTGRLDYMDNQIDPETGTVRIRGIIPNPDNQLYPGMFVRLRVPAQTMHNAVLVQQKAIGTDIGGKYLLVVDKDNIVRHQPVKLGRQVGDLQVVLSGLSAGERYIVAGLQAAYPGTEVNPVPEGTEPPAQSQPPAQTETSEQTAPADAS